MAMIAKLTALAALLLGLVVPSPAFAQYREQSGGAGFYREGQPDVLTPPAPRNPDAAYDATRDQFAAWTRSNSRPATLILWNRAYTDDTATRETEYLRESEEIRSGASAGGETVTRRDLARTVSSVPETGGLFGAPTAMLSAYEVAFASAFQQADTRLLDRQALLRRTAAGMSAQDRADAQFVESRALNGGVVYLIEVLPSADSTSPTGYMFRVSVRHLPSSRMVAQFSTNATPPPGQSRFTAGSHGFERVQDRRLTADHIGAQLAIETMLKVME